MTLPGEATVSMTNMSPEYCEHEYAKEELPEVLDIVRVGTVNGSALNEIKLDERFETILSACEEKIMARINGELANHSMEARIRQALDELAVRVEGAVSMSTDAVKRIDALQTVVVHEVDHFGTSLQRVKEDLTLLSAATSEVQHNYATALQAEDTSLLIRRLEAIEASCTSAAELVYRTSQKTLDEAGIASDVAKRLDALASRVEGLEGRTSTLAVEPATRFSLKAIEADVRQALAQPSIHSTRVAQTPCQLSGEAVRSSSVPPPMRKGSDGFADCGDMVRNFLQASEQMVRSSTVSNLVPVENSQCHPRHPEVVQSPSMLVRDRMRSPYRGTITPAHVHSPMAPPPPALDAANVSKEHHELASAAVAALAGMPPRTSPTARHHRDSTRHLHGDVPQQNRQQMHGQFQAAQVPQARGAPEKGTRRLLYTTGENGPREPTVCMPSTPWQELMKGAAAPPVMTRPRPSLSMLSSPSAGSHVGTPHVGHKSPRTPAANTRR
mmetsp:Transcript_34721/g.79597  ORF Transcript_34721/g.79597 Transcript_34721/m.79597 type:complete len:499 (-) Transcript_34721:85-1581(-)